MAKTKKRTSRLINYVNLLRKLFITALGVAVPVLSSLAQLHWKKTDSTFGNLPSSIQVYLASDSLDGAPFMAYYASVKLKDKQLVFSVQTGDGFAYTPKQFYTQQEHAPWLVVNGPFFSFENNQVLSLLIRNGKIISHNVDALKGSEDDSMLYYYPTRSAIGNERPMWPGSFLTRCAIVRMLLKMHL
jgi:hypothetical protein